MIKKIWTWKRISIIVLLCFLSIYTVASLKYSLAAGDLEVSLIFLAVLAFFLYWLFKNACPKQFDCMKIVRRYLSFGELKSFIEKETFHKYVCEDISEPFTLYYSEKWFFINNVYIPRALVLDVIVRSKSIYSSWAASGIVTKNGEGVFLAEIRTDETEKVISKLKKEFPEFKNDVENLKKGLKKEFYKQSKKEFEMRIPDKIQFMEYCGIKKPDCL